MASKNLTPAITPQDENSPQYQWNRGENKPTIKRKRNCPNLSRKKQYSIRPPIIPKGTKTKNPNRYNHVKSLRKKFILPPKPLINPYMYFSHREKEVLTQQNKIISLQKQFLTYQSNTKKIKSWLDFQFNHVKDLNSGSFGKVSLIRSITSGKEYALKKLKKKVKTLNDMNESFNEIFALSALDKCPYINHFYNAWLEQNFLHIQLEYCIGGCVHQLFLKTISEQKDQYPFTQNVLIRFIRHLCLALEWMHSRNMCHLDVKPQNILIQGGINDLMSVNFVLCDFGNVRNLSCSMDEIELGDGAYLAPELLGSRVIDLEKVDIFGIGASVYELICRKTLSKEWHNVKKGCLQNFSGYTSKLNDLVKRMVAHPIYRPKPIEVLNDPLLCVNKPHINCDSLLQRIQEQNAEIIEAKKENKRLRRRNQQLNMNYYSIYRTRPQKCKK